MGDCGRMWLKVEGGGRIMFMSEYSHSIDSKGRMILPAKFREELGDHFVLAPGLDSCLCIYTMEHWNNLISKFEQMSATHQNVRKVKRYLITLIHQDIQSIQRRLVMLISCYHASL